MKINSIHRDNGIRAYTRRPGSDSGPMHYPLCDFLNWEERERLGPNRFDVYAVATGEFRPPRKGERYLSGAQIAAYLAPKDFTTSYHIARLVKP